MKQQVSSGGKPRHPSIAAFLIPALAGFLVASTVAGCDSGPKPATRLEDQLAPGVPDPDNPLSDVNLQNEAQNLDRIRKSAAPKARR